MPNPEISIVTPVFNSVRWIELCLQSVRHALQGQSYEHIVVDGCSTDGTLEYLKQQKDIRFIPGPDKGMYDALNKGMAATRGRTVGHLNADEQYDRAGLAHARQRLDQTGADAVFGPTIMLDERLNFLYLFNQITVPRPIDADWHMPVQTCSFLFRRPIWERCPYPSEYRIVGDHVWFRRQMKLGLKLVSVRKPRMRLAKLFFRLRHLLRCGTLRPFRLEWEIFGFPTGKVNSKLFFPKLHLKRSRSANRICK